MAKHDEWCELCDDKIKQHVIVYNGQVIEVCNHCKSLAIG